jgi:two-component system chemotaxis response regulator CheB
MPIENNTLNVAAVGASAGGVEALTRFVAGLPADLPYAVLVTLHLPSGAPSVLARILDRSGPLPAEPATDGVPLEPGTIRVAVPDRHLLVHDHRIVLAQGPTENGHRPAINALFRSVALSIGRRAVSVLLSGVLDDGTLGTAAIRSRGGTTIAQSPSDALFRAMPLAAIEAGVVDHQVEAGAVGSLLTRLAERTFEEPDMKHDASLELENRIAMSRRFSTEFNTEDLGSPSGYTCPDCHGALIGVSEGNYRCHVGHAWTTDALLRARDGEIESALWVAMRSLQEKAKLSRRLAGQVGAGVLHNRYQAIADETEHAMSVLGNRLSDVYAQHENSSG